MEAEKNRLKQKFSIQCFYRVNSEKRECSAPLWPFNFSPQLMRAAKIVSEYDQEIPQSQTADNPVAPRGRAAQPSRDTRKTN